jgi:hypothetical protein
VVAGLFALAVAPLIVLQAGPSGSLFYSVPAAVTLNEPIIVDVTFRNDTSEALRIDPGSPLTNFQFDVIRPSGQREQARPGFAEGFYAGGRFELESGQNATKFIVLNQWAEFSEVGSYQVAVHFGGAISGKAGASINGARDWSGHIEVRPRDAEALRRTCREFLRVARANEDGRRGRALTALAQTRDVEAIPFILEAASIEGSTDLIEGLVRIGGAGARRALEQLSVSSDQLTALSARGALQRIK